MSRSRKSATSGEALDIHRDCKEFVLSGDQDKRKSPIIYKVRTSRLDRSGLARFRTDPFA